MRNLYRAIQSQLENLYNYAGDDMLEMNKDDLLSIVVEELLFEVDVRQYSFDDIFVSLKAAVNQVFDDYTYSDVQVIRCLNPLYLEHITNLLSEPQTLTIEHKKQ